MPGTAEGKTMPSVRKIKRRMPHLNIASELEAMARKGWAVSLIYDDAGNWAFGTDGMQNCRNHGDDLTISWWVKAADFKPSIQAAWNHFQQQQTQPDDSADDGGGTQIEGAT